MVSFDFFGVRLRLDFSFFAAVGIFLALDRTGYGICCLSACFCHEAGHLAVMLIEKKLPEEIIFSGGGICIKRRGDASLAVLAAGCLVNFLLFWVYCFSLPHDNIFKLLFGGANLAIGLFNLLPVGELDGRRILEKVCFRLFSFSAAEKVLKVAGFLGYIAAAVAAAFLVISGRVNLTAVSVMVYVFLMDFLIRN